MPFALLGSRRIRLGKIKQGFHLEHVCPRRRLPNNDGSLRVDGEGVAPEHASLSLVEERGYEGQGRLPRGPRGLEGAHVTICARTFDH